MFDLGASTPNAAAAALIRKIAPILAKLPEKLSIGGYTDAAPYHGGDKSNWDLSTERANATRRLLVESGLTDGRFESVTGHADRDLLLPADPLAAANRRVAIVVLRNHPLPHHRLPVSASAPAASPSPAYSAPASPPPVSR
jgi:chemotaxis protein MotB